jgi:hypothetical protein
MKHKISYIIFQFQNRILTYMGSLYKFATVCALVEACALVAAAAVYKQGAEMLSLFESD